MDTVVRTCRLCHREVKIIYNTNIGAPGKPYLLHCRCEPIGYNDAALGTLWSHGMPMVPNGYAETEVKL